MPNILVCDVNANIVGVINGDSFPISFSYIGDKVLFSLVVGL